MREKERERERGEAGGHYLRQQHRMLHFCFVTTMAAGGRGGGRGRRERDGGEGEGVFRIRIVFLPAELRLCSELQSAMWNAA